MSDGRSGQMNGMQAEEEQERLRDDRAVDRPAPEAPTDLPRPAWGGVLKRTLREYSNDNLSDLAAALTYYGVLAIFPMLIVIVSVLGLIGNSVTQPLIQTISALAPGSASKILINAITNIQS